MGADFYKAIYLKNECTGVVRDLTGYTAKMQVRATVGGTVILTPVMTVTGATGKIEATATGTVTGALTPGLYYYDWIITSPASIVERILEGKFQISSRITV